MGRDFLLDSINPPEGIESIYFNRAVGLGFNIGIARDLNHICHAFFHLDQGDHIRIPPAYISAEQQDRLALTVQPAPKATRQGRRLVPSALLKHGHQRLGRQ